MQIQTSTQTHINSIVEQRLMTLKLDSPSSPSHSQEEEKPSISFTSANSKIPTYSSILDCSSSPPPSFTLAGDYINVESCLDFKDSVDIDLGVDVFPSSSSSKEEDTRDHIDSQQFGFRKKKKVIRRELPPPIPLLARTENLPSRMPWVLKRYYTSDGRLILREEKVRHHGYFRAHRSNGRLTLQLVPLDDDISIPSCDHQYLDAEVECRYNSDGEGGEGEEHEDGITENGDDSCHNNEEEEVVDYVEKKTRHSCNLEGGNNGGSGGNGGKCLSFDSTRMGSTCIFGVPVTALRPVHG